VTSIDQQTTDKLVRTEPVNFSLWQIFAALANFTRCSAGRWEVMALKGSKEFLAANSERSPSMSARSSESQGTPRFKIANRSQTEWRFFSLEEFVPADAPVRAVWAFVETLDLSILYDQIRAVEGAPGRDPIDPRILFSLWLYATIEGVGSARRLERLCERDLSFMWLCGNVSVNYHTLSDFRTQHVALLDELLTQGVAAMLQAGLVELRRVAQDGMRVRACAGSSSFRGERKLQESLEEAEAQLAALKQEEAADGGAETRREAASKKNAAEQRAERIRRAIVEREKVAAKMEERKKESGTKARASTTDPEARVMKMGDGGFRPAHNVQFATTTDSLVIVGVDVVNAGTDGSQMGPMVDQLRRRYQQQPKEFLADGGFVKLSEITRLGAAGIELYLPVMEQAQKRAKGIDPFAPMKGDTPQIAAWRQRMGTPAAKEIYQQRASSAELVNAGCRNRGLIQFLVRGLEKVRAVALWHALAHNFQRFRHLTTPQLVTN
jgi:transposase